MVSRWNWDGNFLVVLGFFYLQQSCLKESLPLLLLFFISSEAVYVDQLQIYVSGETKLNFCTRIDALM